MWLPPPNPCATTASTSRQLAAKIRHLALASLPPCLHHDQAPFAGVCVRCCAEAAWTDAVLGRLWGSRVRLCYQQPSGPTGIVAGVCPRLFCCVHFCSAVIALSNPMHLARCAHAAPSPSGRLVSFAVLRWRDSVWQTPWGDASNPVDTTGIGHWAVRLFLLRMPMHLGPLRHAGPMQCLLIIVCHCTVRSKGPAKHRRQQLATAGNSWQHSPTRRD